MTPDKLVDELDRIVQVPGLANVWVPPIRNRIDMLATGIKSPVGIKVSGSDLNRIDELTGRIADAVKTVPGVTSALAERLTGGRYLDIEIDRNAIARYGLAIDDVQAFISTAIGGENVGEVIAGRQRFPLNLRFPREIETRSKHFAICLTLPTVARVRDWVTSPRSNWSTDRRCCAPKTRDSPVGSTSTCAVAICDRP